MLYQKIIQTVDSFSFENITKERKFILEPLIKFIQEKITAKEQIRLNFICTHNSRRSHLAQIWAQTMAFHYGLENIFCYSGGTEATSLFPKVAETLIKQGFYVHKISTELNSIYLVKFDESEMPMVCFSKVYDHPFNPSKNFAAIMTCDSADAACPMVFGARERISIKYEDPKIFDNTPLQDAKYTERSIQIAQEMGWVLSQVVARD